MLEALIFVVFPFCMVFAAVSDTLSMTIANRVPLLLVAVFAVVAPLTGMDWVAYGWHFAAGAIVLAATFGLFALGGMGGGDAKLLSATAVWMGLNLHLIEYLVASAFLGGLLTMAILVYRGSPLAVYTGRNMFLRNFANAKGGIPYGIALGTGGLVTYPGSPLMVWAMERLATQ
jgi:prepilin peptidase CpaA